LGLAVSKAGELLHALADLLGTTPQPHDLLRFFMPGAGRGGQISEWLDVIPPKFRVIVTHRPKYACRACEEAVVN
jgi:hypothetical protein